MVQWNTKIPATTANSILNRKNWRELLGFYAYGNSIHHFKFDSDIKNETQPNINNQIQPMNTTI
jgi:hypothetical protein